MRQSFGQVRALHTREVAGSKPAAPILGDPLRRAFCVLPMPPTVSSRPNLEAPVEAVRAGDGCGNAHGSDRRAAGGRCRRARLGLAPDPASDRLRDTPCFTMVPRPLDDSVGASAPRTSRFARDAPEAQAPLADWWPRNDDPLVYLSFGSIAGRAHLPFFPALYRAAIDALAPLRARVLVTVGSVPEPLALNPVPANVHVEKRVAHDAVARHAAGDRLPRWVGLDAGLAAPRSSARGHAAVRLRSMGERGRRRPRRRRHRADRRTDHAGGSRPPGRRHDQAARAGGCARARRRRVRPRGAAHRRRRARTPPGRLGCRAGVSAPSTRDRTTRVPRRASVTVAGADRATGPPQRAAHHIVRYAGGAQPVGREHRSEHAAIRVDHRRARAAGLRAGL